MSLLNYFKRKTPEERGIFLPTPVTTESISEEEVAACNKEVETAIVKNERQTKQYCSYSAKERASIGRYAAQHGPTAAARHFSKLLGHPVPESRFSNLGAVYTEIRILSCTYLLRVYKCRARPYRKYDI